MSDTEGAIVRLQALTKQAGEIPKRGCKQIWANNPDLNAIGAALAALREKQSREKLPHIVCLCGSTRFFKEFDEANFKFTLEGKIVLSIGCNTKSDEGLHLTAEDKKNLDELHKRKIDLADSVYVLNIGGYIGESTRSEIAYAEAHGKPVVYAEPKENTNE